MRRPTLPEKLALAVPLVASACSSDHHVSPWGGRALPPLGAFVERPDLGAQVALIDAETSALGLHLDHDLRIELPHGGGPAILRGYGGADSLGRPVHAVRLATVRGVIMAIGPLDIHDAVRDQPTELVPALVPGQTSGDPGAFRAGTDLNDDGMPDVVLKNDAGVFQIWHVGSRGAAPYEVWMKAPPMHVIDIDGDSRLDLAGELPVEPHDPLAPRFTDVATFDGIRYSNKTANAVAFHSRLAALSPASERGGKPGKESSTPEPLPKLAQARLRMALERAFHAVLAGRPVQLVEEELRSQTAVPAALRAPFERHVRWLLALKR